MCGPIPPDNCGQPDCAGCNPCQLMHVTGEIWPVAADELGIWLVSGRQPWTTRPFFDDTSFNAEFDRALAEHGVVRPARVGPHGTSCRIDGAFLITVAVVAFGGGDASVRASWPGARPIPPQIMTEVGKPPTHPANRVPDEVRQWDTLVGALRHLAFQLTPYGDAELADKLDGWWRPHLANWAPILFRLYDRVYGAA